MLGLFVTEYFNNSEVRPTMTNYHDGPIEQEVFTYDSIGSPFLHSIDVNSTTLQTTASLTYSRVNKFQYKGGELNSTN